VRVLGIDQGTTSTRAHLFEGDAAPVLVASLRHQQIYRQPGWVEHDPLEILSNVRRCLDDAGQVDAVGLANQGESCLAWDSRTLQPISPVIVWQDRRAETLVERLKAQGLEAQVRRISGLPLDSYFSAAKYAWLLAEMPDVRAALSAGRLRLGTTDTFLLNCLAGVNGTDPTTASRTGLMNLATRRWDPALCEIFGVPIEVLAPIRSSAGPFGDYKGSPFCASIVDQQAALYGHGCMEAGDAKITFGTGAFALALAGDTAPLPDESGLICTVAWQTLEHTRYALEGGVYDAGAAVEWAMRIGLLTDPAELLDFSDAPAIGRGLAFVPALSGLACPQWDRSASARWTGMTTATTRRDLQQSILEGIALQTTEVVQALDRRVKLGDVLRVDGGLSASNYFLRFLAGLTGKTILRTANAERTAYGCARLAGLPARPADAPRSEDSFEGAMTDSNRLDWIGYFRSQASKNVLF
jgi:glycerol kinase